MCLMVQIKWANHRNALYMIFFSTHIIIQELPIHLREIFYLCTYRYIFLFCNEGNFLKLNLRQHNIEDLSS